jgi:thiamine pyrophosphokinase
VDAPRGATVSVIAPGGAEGVFVAGADWPLEDASLAPLSGHGVSNRATGGAVVVSARSGTLIVFVQEDAGCGIY